MGWGTDKATSTQFSPEKCISRPQDKTRPEFHGFFGSESFSRRAENGDCGLTLIMMIIIIIIQVSMSCDHQLTSNILSHGRALEMNDNEKVNDTVAPVRE